MKPKPLTLDVINNINKDTILYAEFSEPGAMGACGTARIFLLDDGILQFYLASVLGGKNEKEKEVLNSTYASVYKLLKNLTKDKVLIEKYAGFGNTAWKRHDVIFERDDDHSMFIYKKTKQTYLIPASNPGVYHKVVADFAKRQVPIKDIKKHYDKCKKELLTSEQDFFEAYLAQLEENDSHLGIFQFTVAEYWDAICLLKYQNLQDFNLSLDAIRDGQKALARYRLRYVLDTLGWNQLDEFFAKFVKDGSTHLFETLDAKLSYRVEDIYTEVKVKKCNNVSIQATHSDNLEKFLNKPELIDYSDSAKNKIIEDILTADGASIRANARSIELFLANFCFQEDTPYSKLLPAVHHIVEEIPFDDFNHTQTAQLFWLVGEVINRAWTLSDARDKKTQININDFIFTAYGSRVGSLWPIAYYGEFEFKDSAGQEMFSDSIGFIMSLNDITDRIPGLEPYLKKVAEQNYHAHPTVLSRAKSLIRDTLPPTDTLEHILDHEDESRYSILLSHPDSIEETNALLNKLITGDKRFGEYSRVSILERLFLNNTYSDSRIVTAKFVNDHFRELAFSLDADAKSAKENPGDFLISIFTAACKGILEPEELTEIESLADKYQALNFDTRTIVSALKLANYRINKISEIREDLATFFA